MSKNNIPYIRLTDLSGNPVMLSPVFTISSSQSHFVMDRAEKEELHTHIQFGLEGRGLNVDRLNVDPSSWKPKELYYAHYGKKRDEESCIFSGTQDFQISCNRLISPMEQKHQEQVVDSNDGSTSWETTIQAVTSRVIQTEDDIRAALDSGSNDLHDSNVYTQLRQGWLKSAKEAIDKNLDRIDAKPSVGMTRFEKLIGFPLSVPRLKSPQ